MKKILVSLAAAMLLLLVLAGIAHAATGVTDLVRQATANCHDVNAAMADGFIPTPQCVQEPGLAGSGVKPILAGSGVKPVLAGGGGASRYRGLGLLDGSGGEHPRA